MLQKIENWFFKFRLPVLAAFVLITIVMAYFAVQIRMDAGFAKQLPNSHSFVKTYYEYQDDLSGTNSITVALRTTEGDIFTKEYLSNLFRLNNTIRYLPGVNQGSMQSLWTPNIRVMRVTEEGFESSEVIPGTVIPENLTPEIIENIKERILTGGHVGSIVANDFTSSLIKVELTEYNPKTGEKLDYLKLGQEIETIREQYEIGEYRVEITGFAKMISDIANEAYNVVIFFWTSFLSDRFSSLLVLKILDINISPINLLPNIAYLAIWDAENSWFWIRPSCNSRSFFSFRYWCFSWNSTGKSNNKGSY